MKQWEIIADKLSAVGWTWGYCSAVTPYGLAHPPKRDEIDEKMFVKKGEHSPNHS